MSKKTSRAYDYCLTVKDKRGNVSQTIMEGVTAADAIEAYGSVKAICEQINQTYNVQFCVEYVQERV